MNSSFARFADSASTPRVGELGYVELHDGNPGDLTVVVDERLIGDVVERLFGRVIVASDHRPDRPSDKRLPRRVDLVEPLEEALSCHRHRLTRRSSEQAPSGHEIDVLAVGELEHVFGTPEDGHADRRMCEDAGKPHGMRLLEQSHLGPHELRFDPRDQLARRKRLHEIVIGAGVQSVDAGLFTRARREQDDRNGPGRVVGA